MELAGASLARQNHVCAPGSCEGRAEGLSSSRFQSSSYRHLIFERAHETFAYLVMTNCGSKLASESRFPSVWRRACRGQYYSAVPGAKSRAYGVLPGGASLAEAMEGTFAPCLRWWHALAFGPPMEQRGHSCAAWLKSPWGALKQAFRFCEQLVCSEVGRIEIRVLGQFASPQPSNKGMLMAKRASVGVSR